MVLAHNINEGNRTQDVSINQDVTFETMLLTSRTLQGLKDSGFYKPSPIQLHGIPLGKCGFDLLLEAKSGTGKTAVFSIIALEKIDINKGLQVVILAPTREIAMQICDVIKQIGARHKGLRVEVVMGGLPLIDDINKFKNNVHIVVASPGRLKHLIHDKYIDTAAVRLLILDEADKLMEKSFQSEISYINLTLPKQKQIIMSSATYPESCKTLISNYVHNAQHICPDNNNVLLGIEQKVTVVKYNCNIIKQTQYRFKELLKILTNRQFKQCLIFCNYQARVGELYKMLTKEKWPVEQLYGQQDQTDRLDALKTLQEYKCRLLISTDLAARGIDASNVDLVINFEPPVDWQTYLHRIGRAGRFGSYGFAITILSEVKEQNKFKTLLESMKLPCHLTNLWTNSEFCVNNNNVPNSCLSDVNLDRCKPFELNNESMPTINNKSNKKLWNVLTSNFNLVGGVHENSKSCVEDETHDKLESFQDLLESFNTNNDANCKGSDLSPKDLVELSPKDLQTTKIERTDNFASTYIIQKKQNDKKTDDLHETNINFRKAGIQNGKFGFDEGQDYQVLNTENTAIENCTYSSLSQNHKNLSTESLGLQTKKLTPIGNCDNEVEIQINNKSEDVNKINDKHSSNGIEKGKFELSIAEKYYEVLEITNSITSAHCVKNQNLTQNLKTNKEKKATKNGSRNAKNLGDKELLNNTDVESNDISENYINMESGMCETLAKSELPTVFYSSRDLKSHNNYINHVKYSKPSSSSLKHFKTNKCDEQLNQLNGKDRHMKSKIMKSCKLKDKFNGQTEGVQHENNSVYHDFRNNGEDVTDTTVKNSTDSQYHHNHCNLNKDQERIEKCNRTYKEWFRSLKLHVKQVELLMYFDELRKTNI